MRKLASFLVLFSAIVAFSTAQTVYLRGYDRFATFWDGSCGAGLCNATAPCAYNNVAVTDQDCTVVLLSDFNTDLTVKAGPYKLTLSSIGKIGLVGAPISIESTNRITLLDFGITANGTGMYVNLTAPEIIVMQSELDIGRSNWVIEGVENLQFINSEVTSPEASEAIIITPSWSAEQRSLSFDQVVVDLVLGAGSVLFDISNLPMNVTLNGVSGLCNRLLQGQIEDLTVTNTNLYLFDAIYPNINPIFSTFSPGSTSVHDSNFTCVQSCSEYSHLVQRTSGTSNLVLENLIIRSMGILDSEYAYAIVSSVFVDVVDSDHVFGAFAVNRAPIDLTIRRSKFTSNSIFPILQYSDNYDLNACIQSTQMQVPEGKMPALHVSMPGKKIAFSCPSSVSQLSHIGLMSFTGTLTITEKLIGGAGYEFSLEDTSHLILASSLSLDGSVVLNATKGHITYIPSDPMEGISDQVGIAITLPADIATQFDIVWPLHLPAPLPGVFYPLFPFIRATVDTTLDSSNILVQTNTSYLNFLYNPIPCNSQCVANSSALCANSDRCSCQTNWFGPLCDCDQSLAPSGVICSVLGGRNWILDGTMFLPSSASVNLTSAYTLNVVGDMHLDGAVGLNDATVVVATGIIYSNGKLSGYCKLREFRHNGACVVYSSVSVQSYALEFSNLTEIELILDASDLTTDGSCTPPNPPDALDGLVNSTFNALTHSVMSSNASWSFRIVTGRNSSNPQDLQKLSFETKILKSGDLSKSTGSTTKLLSSSSDASTCTGAVNPTGTMTLFVSPCSNPASPNSKSGVAWYVITFPIIGAVILITIIIVVVLKVDAVRSVILPYHRSGV